MAALSGTIPATGGKSAPCSLPASKATPVGPSIAGISTSRTRAPDAVTYRHSVPGALPRDSAKRASASSSVKA